MQQQALLEVGTNLEASEQIHCLCTLVLCILTDLPNGNAHGCIFMMVPFTYRVLAGHRQADNPTTDAASRWGSGGNGAQLTLMLWSIIETMMPTDFYAGSRNRRSFWRHLRGGTSYA